VGVPQRQAHLTTSTAEIEVSWEQEAVRLIESEVRRIKRDWRYTNDGEAFVHLFVRSYFNLDDDEASEVCQVGYAGRDKGIDALYLDESNSTIYIIGGKFEHKSYGPEIVTGVRQSFDFLTGTEPAKAKRELHEAWGFYHQHIEKGFSTTYLLAVYGTVNDEAARDIRSLSIQLDNKRWSIEVIQRPEILIHASAPIAAPAKGPSVEFGLKNQDRALEFHLDGPRFCVAFIKAGELADLAAANGASIFALNLREYLGRNPVNKKIQETLTDSKTIGYFPYLNLGIDAICDYFEIGVSTQRVLPEVKGLPALKVKNFRIVNGCQTTMTLLHNRELANKCLVMLRLVATKKESLAFDIAVAKNRQTAIKDRELFAHDPIQMLIAEKLGRLTKPFFYERRRGEWRSMKRDPKYRRRFGGRVIENDKVARAYLSTVMQKPFEAKHRARFIFRPDDEGGIYEKVFRPELPPEDLVRAAEFFEVVRIECKKLRKEQRQLATKEEKEALSELDSRRLQELSYLAHADTYLAALMWYLCNKHVPDRKKIDRAFITFDVPLNHRKTKKLQDLFAIASNVIVQHLSLEEKISKERGMRFNVRNFFALTDSYGSLKETADRFVAEPQVVKILQ
jgi:hypothetical protein